MLLKRHLKRYADVLLWGLQTARTQKFKKNDIILIRYNTPAMELAEILYDKILEQGMNPVQRLDLTSAMELSFYKQSNDKQLVFKTPGDETLYQSINGNIFLHAPDSITHLKNIDPKKISKATVARKYIREIFEKREEQGAFSWTLCVYPTQELARHAGLSYEEYSRQIIKACFLNRRSPVVHWKKVLFQANEIKKWLNSLKVKSFHIESKNIDLKITPGEKRKWVGVSGHNIPSFEIFLSPDWHGTSGTYFANQPSFRNGNFIEGIKLIFDRGKAVKATAKTGQDFLEEQLSMDAGSNKIGEFSLTDKRFSKINMFMANTLFDENFGGRHGNCHIAIGSSYSDTYNGNQKKLSKSMKKSLGFNDSALHWDLVNTEKKRVVAFCKNGEKVSIYENGKFLY